MIGDGGREPLETLIRPHIRRNIMVLTLENLEILSLALFIHIFGHQSILQITPFTIPLNQEIALKDEVSMNIIILLISHSPLKNYDKIMI